MSPYLLKQSNLCKWAALLPLMLSLKMAKAQNIGLGTTTPHASAQLEISATNRGLLIPRVTQANRPANPATGLLIYQTDNTPGFYFYNGTAWQMLGGGGGLTLPYTGSTAGNALNITSTGGIAITGASSATSGNWYGGQFTSASTAGSGVYGAATAATGTNYGGQFVSLSSGGRGIYAEAASLTGETYAGHFVTRSSGGLAIYAENLANSGTIYAGRFDHNGGAGSAILGLAKSSTSSAAGVIGETYGESGAAGIRGLAYKLSGISYGVYGMSSSTIGVGLRGMAWSETGNNRGVEGSTRSSFGTGGYFSNLGAVTGLALQTAQGDVEFQSLAGTGTRMVVANATGRLSTQAIPGGQWAANGNDIYNSNSANVGIGINNPSAKLMVASSGDYGTPQLWLQQTQNDFSRIRMQTMVGGFWDMAARTGALPQNDTLNLYTDRTGNIFTLIGDGRLGLGTPNPTTRLDVDGQVRIRGGVPGAGKVLTSDANGLASWQAPAPHNHFGEVWQGYTDNGLLVVNLQPGSRAMAAVNMAETGNNYGLEGTIVTNTGIGVWGNIEGGEPVTFTAVHAGVAGGGFTRPGIYGQSYTGNAAIFRTRNNTSAATILAEANGSNALELNNGFIKVSGSNRTAFQHTTTAGNVVNNYTILNYPNQQATDMVMVIPVYTSAYVNSPLGVWFFEGTWRIFRQDQASLATNMVFNVLVIKQ